MAAVINVALSHAFVGKMPAPVSDPNLEVSGGGGGGRSSPGSATVPCRLFTGLLRDLKSGGWKRGWGKATMVFTALPERFGKSIIF